MPWWYAVAERDHVIQNPTSHAKISLLGEYLRLTEDSHVDEGYVTLAETASRFGAAGVEVTGLIASSDDDWDRYNSLHWRAVDEWLAEHPDDPAASEIRERHERLRDEYLQRERASFGWAIFIGRKR
jgi:hypothetical protein